MEVIDAQAHGCAPGLDWEHAVDAAKLSAIPTLSRRPYPFEDLWPYLHQVVSTFGADRLMWDSDLTRVAGRICGSVGTGPAAAPRGRPGSDAG